jgi:uncharacterized RDD family membrane protein YckC
VTSGRAPVDTILELTTPEHLAFRTRLAGPGQRLLAWLVDALLSLAILTGLLTAFGGGDDAGLGGFVYLGIFALDWGYHVAWETLTGGRSAGKLVVGLRVVREDGLPATWRESLLRNLLRAADLALFPPFWMLPGPLVTATDPRFRRIGDLVAGTIVVRTERAELAREPQVQADPALAERLPGRPPLERDELEALDLFVYRKDLGPARRAELARMIAPVLARRLSLPEPEVPEVFLATLNAKARAAPRDGR